MLFEKKLRKKETRKHVTKKDNPQRKKSNYVTLEEQINCFAEIMANHILNNSGYEHKKN